ncbi:MAG: hypothetical protein KBT69_04370 [Oceanihabitans sp.]|nr:hypothetical protein [Oceanihabitans sp.]
MKTPLKGNINFIENYTNWSLEIEVKWNKRMTTTTIKSRKLDLKTDFLPCKLSLFRLFTLLSYMSYIRSDSFSFYGTRSAYSDLILASPATLPLMECKNATIKLEGKHLIFSGGTRKKDMKSLSNVFTLNERLMKEIDLLHSKTKKRVV